MPEPSASLPIVSLSPADAHCRSRRPSACHPSACRAGSKSNIPLGDGNHFTARLVEELGLETVCESAKCPNRMECWSQRTATFMIMGNVCTRPCGFCSVPKGKTAALEIDEPERVAEAAARLGLQARRHHLGHARRSGRRRGRALLSLGAGGSR